MPFFTGGLSEATRKNDLFVHVTSSIPAQAGCLFEAGDSVTGAFIGVVRKDCDDSKCSTRDCIFGPDDAKSCGPGLCSRSLDHLATSSGESMRLIDCEDDCCRLEVPLFRRLNWPSMNI